jgi:hypothetical protein
LDQRLIEGPDPGGKEKGPARITREAFLRQ